LKGRLTIIWKGHRAGLEGASASADLASAAGGAHIIARMPAPENPSSASRASDPTNRTDATHTSSAARSEPAAAADKVLCDRCGAEMFRMHAVWRCPACRYKTDCCGW
jgi:rubrerythrin